MPSHNRSLPEIPSNGDADQPNHNFIKQTRREPNIEDLEDEYELPEREEDEDDKEQEDEEEEEEEEDERDAEEDDEREKSAEFEEETASSGSEEKPEFVYVVLPEVRKDVQCPICLGIIKKTRTVMECLHRFCRECIDKSMRLGNNECPACRTHCASRRSLRDDPNFDALITALYPDIDKYEEEELAFHEDERNRNKQIQASIAETLQRQTEALVKKRQMGKETGSSLVARPQRNSRSAFSSRRRNARTTDRQGSDDSDDQNEVNEHRDSSSTDEQSIEIKRRRRRRRTGSFQPISSTIRPNGVCAKNDIDGRRENMGISPGLPWNKEMLAWGRGGLRSHTRYGNNKNSQSQSTRCSKLVEHLECTEEKNDEIFVHLMLVSVDKGSMQSLQEPYLCCRPSLSIKQLCEYVARQTNQRSEEVEILVVKGHLGYDGSRFMPESSVSIEEMKVLDEQDTLAKIQDKWSSSRDGLVLAYHQKRDIKSQSDQN